GRVLARVVKQLRSRAAAAAVGNAGGVDVPMSIIPFLLRGVSLLGIDSVLQPFSARELAWERLGPRAAPELAWERLFRDLDLGKLETMIRPATLAEVPALGADILKGRVQGRVVV